MVGAVNPAFGPRGLPVYEWSIEKSRLVSSGRDTFRLFVGMYDQDACVSVGSISVPGWGVDKGSAGSQDSVACYPVFRLDSVAVSGGDNAGPVVSGAQEAP